MPVLAHDFRVPIPVGCIAAALGAVLLAGACTESTAARPGSLADVEILAGDGQHGVVGQELSSALAVRAVDDAGNALPGVLLNFVVTSGGGHVFAGSALSDDQGVARERWTLGTSISEEQTLEVRSVASQTGEGRAYATFTATAVPGAATQLSKALGDEQFGVPGALLAQPIVAKVTDKYGNAVPGVVVSFSAADGFVNPVSATTDAAGTSASSWTLGTRVDASQAATASVSGLSPLQFLATALVGADATLTLLTGATNLLQRTDTKLADSVRVRLTLPDGRPVSGANITFVPDVSNGVAFPPAARTDGDGRVATSWALGWKPGTQRLVITAPGGAEVSLAVETGLAGRPTHLQLVQGGGQVQMEGHWLPDTIAIQATDDFGDRVPNAIIMFRSSDPCCPYDDFGPSIAQSDGAPYTDTNGIAKAAWRLMAGTDGRQVLHVLTAFSNTPLLDVEARARSFPQYEIAIASGDGQTAHQRETLARPLVVRVTDVNGNPARNTTIQWAYSAGAAYPFEKIVTTLTDANGFTSLNYTTQDGLNDQQVYAYPQPPANFTAFGVTFTAHLTP